jgi:pimeloyl-ACP methyl ester carboxylesterase
MAQVDRKPAQTDLYGIFRAWLASGMRRVLTADGLQLAVEEWGQGPTIVLVHGFPDNRSVWREVAARLAEDFHVVAYDVRGAGQSSPARDYSLAALVGDLVAVADGLGAERFHLVGHDWGSIQGWEAIVDARLAGRIRSFTSIAGPSLDHAGSWLRERLARRELGALAGQLVASSYILALLVPGLTRAIWPLLARVCPFFRQHVDGDGPSAMYRANLPERLRRPRPRRSDVPVQLVVPSADRFVSRAFLDGLERLAPRLSVREVRAGHWVPLARPELVAELIGDHVGAVGGS